MIDNVVLIVTGTLHERDVQELIEKCHPLGMFDRYPPHWPFWIFLVYVFSSWFFFSSIATLAVAQNMRELYRLVLVDTPLAPYFSECLTSEVHIWNLSSSFLTLSSVFLVTGYIGEVWNSFHVQIIFRIWMTWTLRLWGTPSTKHTLKIFTSSVRCYSTPKFFFYKTLESTFY